MNFHLSFTLQHWLLCSDTNNTGHLGITMFISRCPHATNPYLACVQQLLHRWGRAQGFESTMGMYVQGLKTSYIALNYTIKAILESVKLSRPNCLTAEKSFLGMSAS